MSQTLVPPSMIGGLAASQLLGRGPTGPNAAVGVAGGIRFNGTTLELAPGTVIDRAYAEFTATSTFATTIPLDDTIPQNTEGVQVLSASITPKSTTNRVRVRFSTQFSLNTVSGGGAVAALFLNSGANAIMARHFLGRNNGDVYGLSFEFEHVPGATSAQTYAVRLGPNAGQAINVNGDYLGNRFFGGVSRTTLILEEIVA